MKDFMFLLTGIAIGGAIGTVFAKSGQSNRIIDQLLRDRERDYQDMKQKAAGQQTS